MDKINELLEALKAAKDLGKVYDFEVHYPCTNLKSTETNHYIRVGFTLGKGMYHWFKSIPDLDGDVYFEHSYSQNTGASHKGHYYARLAINSLENKTGFNIYK